jgi:hypothetical protein
MRSHPTMWRLAACIARGAHPGHYVFVCMLVQCRQHQQTGVQTAQRAIWAISCTHRDLRAEQSVPIPVSKHEDLPAGCLRCIYRWHGRPDRVSPKGSALLELNARNGSGRFIHLRDRINLGSIRRPIKALHRMSPLWERCFCNVPLSHGAADVTCVSGSVVGLNSAWLSFSGACPQLTWWSTLISGVFPQLCVVRHTGMLLSSYAQCQPQCSQHCSDCTGHGLAWSKATQDNATAGAHKLQVTLSLGPQLTCQCPWH